MSAAALSSELLLPLSYAIARPLLASLDASSQYYRNHVIQSDRQCWSAQPIIL